MSQFIANSFQVPNALIDEVLDKISGNACKIYLLIVRKTRGWHKEADRISYSQIQKYTGLNSRTTISKALDELIDLGLIIKEQGNQKSSNEYKLNDDFCTTKNEQPSPKNGPDKNCTSPKNELASPKNGPQPSPKNGHTEIHIFKNTNIKNKSEYDTHESQTFENLQNSKKPKATAKTSSVKKFITADELIDLGVDNQIAQDYLSIRKTKLTQTAINLIIKQCQLADINLNSALEFCIENSWQSFKAEWYFNRINSNNKKSSTIEELKTLSQNSVYGDNFYGTQSPTTPLIGQNNTRVADNDLTRYTGDYNANYTGEF